MCRRNAKKPTLHQGDLQRAERLHTNLSEHLGIWCFIVHSNLIALTSWLWSRTLDLDARASTVFFLAHKWLIDSKPSVAEASWAEANHANVVRFEYSNVRTGSVSSALFQFCVYFLFIITSFIPILGKNTGVVFLFRRMRRKVKH